MPEQRGSRFARSLAAALLIAAGISTQAFAQSVAPCDRACLRELVDERRFPVVDTAHGVALGIAVFRFAGENGPTLLLAELFKVTGGQLREIRAVVRGIPKGTGAGWPTPP